MMSTALETFKKQQQAVEALNQQASELGHAIASARKELDAIARHEALRDILVQEQQWLQRTEDAVRTVRAWRADEARHYWPGLLWRWCAAGGFALLSAAAAGAGYERQMQPYAAENAYLRSRNDFAHIVEHRMLTMTPTERRQLERLLNVQVGK